MEAILQSFRQNLEALHALKAAVSADMCLLLTWGAGSTVCGCSAERTCGRLSRPSLTLEHTLCNRGLDLISRYSCAPYTPRDYYMEFTRRLLALPRQYYDGFLVLLPVNTHAVFLQRRDPVFRNSNDVGWVEFFV